MERTQGHRSGARLVQSRSRSGAPPIPNWFSSYVSSVHTSSCHGIVLCLLRPPLATSGGWRGRARVGTWCGQVSLPLHVKVGQWNRFYFCTCPASLSLCRLLCWIVCCVADAGRGLARLSCLGVTWFTKPALGCLAIVCMHGCAHACVPPHVCPAQAEARVNPGVIKSTKTGGYFGDYMQETAATRGWDWLDGSPATSSCSSPIISSVCTACNKFCVLHFRLRLCLCSGNQGRRGRDTYQGSAGVSMSARSKTRSERQLEMAQIDKQASSTKLLKMSAAKGTRPSSARSTYQGNTQVRARRDSLCGHRGRAQPLAFVCLWCL